MSDAIASVRRFNRTVTQRAGALEAGFLGLGRPLGAARVLWEIGPGGCEVRELRRRLALDSGYLSRLLRGLEADGLVTVAPAAADRRRRVATLTPAGRAERAELDARSDAVARAMIGSLAPEQQARLVAAMADVERLLAAGEVALRPDRPGAPGRPALRRRLLRRARRPVGRRLRPGDEPVPRTPTSSWSPTAATRPWAAAA